MKEQESSPTPAAGGIRRKIKINPTPYFFLAPSLIILCVFTVYPILQAVRLSFLDYNFVNPDQSEYIGLENFKELFASDRYFWPSLGQTVYYSFGSLIPALLLSLVISLIITESWFAMQKAMRVFYFLPVILSITIAGLIFSWIYNPDFGVLNYALSLVGLEPQSWLGNPKLAMVSIIMMVIWKTLGYNITVWSAGLLAMPGAVREAAKIDGANYWRELYHIRLPLMKPIIMFLMILGLIGAFQSFDAIYVMTQGGPMHKTQVVGYYIWQAAFRDMRIGYASSISWVLFVILIGFTMLQFRWLGREEDSP
ncbi:carbohydrate ABC transporter permease [Cohnella boryungensis]|uniref:Carbohydrate ABC transporter permease n=1 Tax=Cohnella boryungensis TaxID=768479 RepID=A0ABV8SGF7_9BACL